MSSLLPALIILFCAGIPITALNASLFPLILHVTPRAFLGRISSALNPVLSVVSMLSIILAGWFASTILNDFHQTILGLSFGPIDTIFVAAGLLFVLGGLYALISLKHVRLAEKPVHTDEKIVPA